MNETNTSNKEYNQFVSCTTKQFGEYFLHTYKPNLKRNQFEDKLFIENPNLVNILPRACTYVVHNDILVTKLEGCCKFTGFSNIDEDPDDENNLLGIKNDNLFDFSLINSWDNNNELEIIMTEKANGKFAICKIYNNMIICGSKNYHIMFDVNEIDETIINNKNNIIIHSILCDIKTNLYNLYNILEKFNDGYSLVGELCDGQHFVSGDNTISWFGLFKNGIPMETMEALDYLTLNEIKTVKYSKVYDSSSNCELMTIFNSARCLSGEGYVLRCRNTNTNKIILVKVKAIGYIVKRFIRQVLLKGYKYLFSVTNRFIDASDYHQLNTDASIRITNILINFGLWMMSKSYPVSILGHMEIKSVRGHLENGFNKYWQEFLFETKNDDIIVTNKDFEKTFDKNEYLVKIKLYEKRSYFDPVTVVFIQGLQGSGKSTIANMVCSKLNNSIYSKQEKAIYLEQDMFWGDTLSCQGALYHNIANANGPKIIIISRCNINKEQYVKYLDICYELPTKTIFISPEKFNELDLLLSFQGILNRSQQGDLLMVGRHELPTKEITEFVLDNYYSYQCNSNSHLIKMRNDNDTLLNEIKNIIMLKKNIIEYVKTILEEITLLRLSVEEISNNIINIIIDIDNSRIIYNPKPKYIGLYISEKDRLELNEFVNIFVIDDVERTLYNHHITIEFNPKDLYNSIKPYTIAVIEISKLIIRKSDSAAAFLISGIYIDNKLIFINNPHITAKIKSDQKPFISQSFIGLTDGTVDIIEYKKTIETICFWSK